jgi:hypothetical protein
MYRHKLSLYLETLASKTPLLRPPMSQKSLHRRRLPLASRRPALTR